MAIGQYENLQKAKITWTYIPHQKLAIQNHKSCTRSQNSEPKIYHNILYATNPKSTTHIEAFLLSNIQHQID